MYIADWSIPPPIQWKMKRIEVQQLYRDIQ